MHITALAPRNDSIHEPPDFFCLCFRRPYTSICEYRDSQIAQERFAMAALTTQRPTFFEVTHNLPCPGEKGLLFFCPLPLKPIKVHPKTEPHSRQNFFDLIQRFPAKIPRFEHLWLIFLNELTYGLNIGIL